MPPLDPDKILAAISQSKRYRHVAPQVIARLAAEEIPKASNVADAEKRTKRRLHQIFGAYHTALPWDKLLTRLSAAKANAAGFKNVCEEILRGHASTAERIPELPTFYEKIFNITGPPSSILDLACGLNPVAIPWMNLPPITTYTACDIDTEMARFLSSFLTITQTPGEALLNDLISAPPPIQADVAFILKTLPCLRHQSPDVGRILDQIQANWLVISFPTKTLGSKSKGLSTTYRALFNELATPRSWKITVLEFPSELVYIVNNVARATSP